MQYSPYSLEFGTGPVYTDLIRNQQELQEMQKRQELQESLSLFDSTLMLDDLISLDLNCRPKHHFYKHRTKDIYLLYYLSIPGYKWKDVTQDYDWKKVLSNLDDPIFRYDNTRSKDDIEQEYKKWLEMKERCPAGCKLSLN